MFISGSPLEKIDDNHITDPNDLKAGRTYYQYRTTGSSNGPLFNGSFEVVTGEVLDDPRLISSKAILVLEQGIQIYKDLWNLGLAPDSRNRWSGEQFVSTKPPVR